MKKECQRCGECCCSFPLSDQEVKQIMDYLQRHPKAMQTLKVLPPFFQIEACAFLRVDENNKCFCGIYPVRPNICKAFGCKGMEKFNLNCPHGAVSEEFSEDEAKKLVEKVKNGTNLKMMNLYFRKFFGW